jgi:hypothetical protein
VGRWELIDSSVSGCRKHWLDRWAGRRGVKGEELARPAHRNAERLTKARGSRWVRRWLFLLAGDPVLVAVACRVEFIEPVAPLERRYRDPRCFVPGTHPPDAVGVPLVQCCAVAVLAWHGGGRARRGDPDEPDDPGTRGCGEQGALAKVIPSTIFTPARVAAILAGRAYTASTTSNQARHVDFDELSRSLAFWWRDCASPVDAKEKMSDDAKFILSFG